MPTGKALRRFPEGSQIRTKSGPQLVGKQRLLWYKSFRKQLGTGKKYMIGIISLVIVFPNNSPEISGVKVLLPLLPIVLDSLLVVAFRLVRGVHPVSPGKDHVSHRLLRLSHSKSKTILEIWSWTLATSLSSLLFESDKQMSLILPILVVVRMLFIYVRTEVKYYYVRHLSNHLHNSV